MHGREFVGVALGQPPHELLATLKIIPWPKVRRGGVRASPHELSATLEIIAWPNNKTKNNWGRVGLIIQPVQAPYLSLEEFARGSWSGLVKLTKLFLFGILFFIAWALLHVVTF